MKAKLFLVLVLSVLSTQVDAQDLLKRIGRSVGKSVQREIVKKAREKSASQRYHVQTQPGSRKQEEPQQVAPQPQAVVMQARDTGQNIVRDTTLNYIDEYGINHGGGILIGGILWAPVNCGYHATDYPI